MFYFSEDYDLLNRSFHFPAESALVNQKTKSFALFGQTEYSINDDWALTFGARWTDDDKDLSVEPAVEGGIVNLDSISVGDDFIN